MSGEAIALTVVTSVVVPLVLMLGSERVPDVARWVTRRMARLLPEEERARYQAEWLADLEFKRRGPEGDENRPWSMLLGSLHVVFGGVQVRLALAPIRLGAVMGWWRRRSRLQGVLRRGDSQDRQDPQSTDITVRVIGTDDPRTAGIVGSYARIFGLDPGDIDPRNIIEVDGELRLIDFASLPLPRAPDPRNPWSDTPAN